MNTCDILEKNSFFDEKIDSLHVGEHLIHG